MKKPIFTGCATALATPFLPDGQVDFAALGSLIDFQLRGGVSALVVCATTGECVTLSDDEFEKITAFAVERTAGRVPVLAGTGRNSTEAALKLSLAAQSLGVQGLLMVNPYYNKSTQRGIAEHFFHIADRVQTPVLVYNVPSRTGISIAAQTYAELAQHPMIFGAKEASSDISLIAHAIAAVPPDFSFYSGNDDQITAIAALGGRGVISTVSNIVPARVAALCEALSKGDFCTGARLQLALLPIVDAVFAETNPIPLKAALQMLSLCGGRLRLPLVQAEPQTLCRLREILHEADLL